ncbi:MAG TPA: tetratricopeptide repeat protein [Polyangiaceae bacterium]
MQQPPPRRGSGQHSGAFTFEAKLEKEEQLLEALVATLARGSLPGDVWEKLHAAAQRDERMSELAFAFEAVSQGKRLKVAPPAVGAEFLFQAARYFGDVFGDEVGATTYLERALALVPAHAGALEKIEQLLTKAGNTKRLAEVYAATAQHRPRQEQAPMLRRAAELLTEVGGADDKVIEILQQALRLEPGDDEARSRLEALYVKANRLRDVVRMCEQGLAADPPPDEPTRRRLLSRVVELYAEKLHEPERGLPFVEQLLVVDPGHDEARKVGLKLVVVKGLAGRAAAALSAAYEATGGTPNEIARFLGIELESTRGPKKAQLLTRLGKLKSERMGDDKGAFEAFEQALAIDSSDDELRARYAALAAKLGRWIDAAKTLGRVLATVKDPAVKAKAGAQLGEMLLRGGDPKRAKTTLAGVLATADAPPDAVLPAARALREILEGERDPKALCDVVERIASLEEDPEKRREADERVAELATSFKDTARAVAAYERLLDTSSRAKALAALVPLYEASGDPLKQARLLEEQAKDTQDATAARELMMRAAAARAQNGQDVAGAVATCRAVIDRFGPARDVLDLMLPLLESQRQWAELGTGLEQLAGLATGQEHAQVMGRLGLLRLQRLRDVDAAIEAFDRALASDASEKTARSTLEKLAGLGEHRLEAARVLEPVYRREGAQAPLMKLLEVRGSLTADPKERRDALREAADLATEPKKRAALLADALADDAVGDAETSALAKRAAEALATSGDVERAIGLYRRALAFEPQSQELLARIDELLRDRGSPEERVALHRAALEKAGPERRRELLHRIGGIQWHDLDDVDGAIATYRQALENDADDADAHAALVDLYDRASRHEELCSLLEARLARVDGDAARGVRARLAEVAAVSGDADRARAQCARLLEDSQLAPEHLDSIERAGEALGDTDLLRAVLKRRAETAQDPREQIQWFDRLAELEERRAGDLEAAAAAWKRAAALAESAGDDEAARGYCRRARKVAPEDRELTARLVALCERGELWEELPRLYVALADAAAGDSERIDLWLRTANVLADRLGDVGAALQRAAEAFDLDPSRADALSAFEKLSAAAGADAAFERALEDALGRLESGDTEANEARALIMLARTRTLARDPERTDDAARAYRALLADARVDAGHHASTLAAYEALIAADPESPRRRADRRWLLEWRAEHAAEGERAARLIEWARAEEEVFADPMHALALHRRVLDVDPDADESLSAIARLALSTGDTEEALGALRSRRDRAEGAGRVATELEIAQVLLSRTTRWRDALAALRAVLTESPGDATARGLAAQLLAHRSTRADTIAMLEKACDATEDVAVRTQILTRLLEAPADADDSTVRRGWFERLTDLQRDQGDLEAALATSVRAAREMPEVAALWDRAEELSRALRRADEVAALYEEVLARSLGREEALAIGERAVQFHEEWFEDSTRAVRILERVLELDPTADWAFDRLKLLLDSAERWDDLFALYDRALEQATGRKRASLLEDAAQTAKDFADRPDRAIDYLEQLDHLKPGDPKIVGALERLYERQGRHRELVTLLGARLPSFKREEARRTRARIAALQLDELGDPEQALQAIEPMLQRRDADANGSEEEVWALLERILAAAPPVPDPRRTTVPPPSEAAAPRSRRSRKSEPPPTAKGSVRQRAAAYLRDHYAEAGREADLARMLVIELETVKSAKERTRRHAQLAELYEKLGDAANALEQLGASFMLDPGDEAKRAKLAELAERTARLERLADLLAAAADVSDDLERRVSLSMQAATVRADRIGDAAGAITLFSAVLSWRRVPDGEVLVAGRRLDPLLESAGRSEERLDVLERIASVETDATARRDTLARAARLASQLGQDERATALWERRLSEDEADLEALDGLVDVLDRRGDAARLAEVLALRAGAAASDEKRRVDRVRRAKLLGETLDEPAKAITAWREIARDFGEADDVALALATLLRKTHRWKDLAQLLKHGADRTTDDGTRAELLRQLGDVQREEMDQPGEAIETYALSLAANPRNAGARAGLMALAGGDEHGGPSVKVLLEALRASDDWRAVLELTSHRLRVAASDEACIGVLTESADIAEKRAGDASLAFEAIRRAFLLAPAREDLGVELARLAEAASAWRSLVDAYREAIEGAARGDGELVANLWARVGKTLEARLDEPSEALTAYLLVVRSSGDLEIACAAVAVAARLGRWDDAAGVLTEIARARGAAPPELLDAYERGASGAGAWDAATASLAEATAAAGLTGPAPRDIEARLAEWHRDRRGDADAAEAAYERALAHDAANATLLASLARLRRRNRGRPLADSLLRLSRATGGDASLLREAAEVARDAIGDVSLTRSILEELLDLVRARWSGQGEASPPTVEGTASLPEVGAWAVETLAKVHEQQGDARSLLDVLVGGAALPFDPAMRRDLRRRAARVALDGLGDHDRGIALFLSLLDDDANDEEAGERLVSTYTTLGRTRELLALRDRQIAAAADGGRRVHLRLAAASLHVALEEPALAIARLRESLAEQPRHTETVDALVAVLDSEVRTAELRDLLADQAQRAESDGDVPRAVELWARAASVAEDRLRDVRSAETYHARVVALSPRAASLDALARLCASRRDPAAAAQWLERLLEVVEPEGRVDATLRLVDALVDSGQNERATQRLESALAERQDSEPLRERLAGLYREQQAWSRLAHLIADSAAHAPDKAARMARLLEAARLYTGRCAEPESAVPLLEQASDLAPEDAAVRLEHAAALASAKRFDEARVILQAMIDSFGGRRPKERAPVHYQIARLELAMGNRARALVELDTATRVDPQNPEILRTLAELARDDGQFDRAEKSYRALLVALRRREDGGETPAIARSEVLLELSAIAERQGESERAREILESALEAAARTDFEQQRLESALRARGDFETLVRVLEARLARAGESPATARTLSELADVLDGQLGRPHQALPVRLRCIAADPRSTEAHDAAMALARSVGAMDRYVEAVTAMADSATQAGDSVLASAMLARLATIAEQDLHDDRRSAALYERVVDLGMRTPEVLGALDRVYERLGDDGQRARILAMRIEAETAQGGPRAAIDATYRLAAVRLASESTLDEGARMLENALDLEPRFDLAEDALRRATAIDPHNQKLIALYERIGREPGHERALVEALELRSRLPGADIDTVREAVETAMRIGQPRIAESLLERFVEGEQTASQNVANLAWAMGALASLREAAGDLRRAVELKKGAARIADPEVARRLDFEVARIAADKLDDLELAAETYASLHEREPADREAWEPLMAVYRRLGRPRELADLLARIVDYVDDPAERARLRLERVRTLIDGLSLGDDEASPLLREIVDEDPSQVEAALMLAAILERTGSREDLAQLLSRQMDAAKDRGDAQAIASIALRLGALLEGQDRVEARNVYYVGLDWEPKSRPLLDALSRLLAGTDDAAERADVLERRLAVEQGPDAETMAHELARMREEQGDAQGAQRAIELGFRGHPASADLRGRLEATFREQHQWQKLADLCVLDASARVDAVERVARLREAAALRRTELGDARGAAEALRLAREAAPEDASVLLDLVDMWVDAGDPAAAATELTTAIEATAEDAPGRAAMLATRAGVRARAGDESGALEDMEAAFAADRSAYAAGLADRLRASRVAAEQRGDAVAVRVLRLREAQVLPYAGDVEGARAILTDLVKADAKDRGALRTLAGLEAALDRWDAASAALRRLIALEEEPEAVIDTALRLADACERAERPLDARSALERALRLAPADRTVRERLERIYEQAGAWHELADLALEDAKASGEVEARFASLLRAGSILLERAGDASAATAALEEARALRPADPSGAGFLADAYIAAGRAQEASALLEQILGPHKGKRVKELAPVYLRVARVARYAGDAAGEVRALGQALDCDAQNGDVCAEVASRAMDLEQTELANRALRAITLLKTPGAMSKALAYQYMGEIARGQGDPKRALMLLKRALAEDPSLEGAKALIAAIERGA